MNWRHITLGDIYDELTTATNAIASLSPVRIQISVDERLTNALATILGPIFSFLWGGLTALPRLLPQREQRLLPPAQPRPHWRRTTVLESAIAEAWSQGYRTYPDLIESVRLRTGKGCSRRAIARFKQTQGVA